MERRAIIGSRVIAIGRLSFLFRERSWGVSSAPMKRPAFSSLFHTLWFMEDALGLVFARFRTGKPV
ncbi:MAG: hypothetical protein MI723_19285, partial [Caulobacterales bacterium]|nr:hypothetical protein [Caulobacterales bacterium]